MSSCIAKVYASRRVCTVNRFFMSLNRKLEKWKIIEKKNIIEGKGKFLIFKLIQFVNIYFDKYIKWILMYDWITLI